jgi:TolB-like protein
MSFLDELQRRNVIRVAIGYLAGAWLLIQILETLLPIFGIPETSIRLVVIIAAIGFVPVLLASWYFELTPDGLKRDSEVQELQREAVSHRTADRLIAAVLTLAVVYFAVDKFVLDPARDAAEREVARQEGRADALVESFGDRSIVVLPFENISSDPEQEYLGDGLAEELLNLLARVEGLRVISRTSAFSFKGAKITSAEIARQLNVSYVLEGSVRKSGDTLRITAQLIDARADAHVWSDTYDHATENIFDIQDSVAGEVVGHLKTELSLEAPKAERHDPVAYALYMQANQAETDETKRELLERALELDPGFLDAKAELAYAHGSIAEDAESAGDIETAEWHYGRYRSLVDEVLAKNPSHPIINAYRVWEMFFLPDLPRAAMYAERALASEPTHFGALTSAGEVFTRLWRPEQAIPILRYVSERDPLSSYHFDNLSKAYLNAGQYTRAEEAVRVVLVQEPDDQLAEWRLGLTVLLQGKASEALQRFSDHIADEHPLRWHGRLLALHALGRTDDALLEMDRLLEASKLVEENPDFGGIYWFIGTAYAWMDMADEAFGAFEKQREVVPWLFTSMADSPLYANLRDDPRWQPFLASVGIDPEYLASIEFNPRLPAEIRLPQSATTR